MYKSPIVHNAAGSYTHPTEGRDRSGNKTVPTQSKGDLEYLEVGYGSGIESVKVIERSGEDRQRKRKDKYGSHDLDVRAVIVVTFPGRDGGDAITHYYTQTPDGELLWYNKETKCYEREEYLRIEEGRLEIDAEEKESREKQKNLGLYLKEVQDEVLEWRIWELEKSLEEEKNNISIDGFTSGRSGLYQNRVDTLETRLVLYKKLRHKGAKERGESLAKGGESNLYVDFLGVEGDDYGDIMKALGVYMKEAQKKYRSSLWSKDKAINSLYEKCKALAEYILEDEFGEQIDTYTEEETARRERMRKDIEEKCGDPVVFRMKYDYVSEKRTDASGPYVLKKDGSFYEPLTDRVEYGRIQKSVRGEAEEAVVDEMQEEMLYSEYGDTFEGSVNKKAVMKEHVWEEYKKDLQDQISESLAEQGLEGEEQAVWSELYAMMIMEEMIASQSRKKILPEALKTYYGENINDANKRDIWESYEDLYDPREEFWNMDEKSRREWTETIIEEVIVNGTMIAVSGGMASLARSGVRTIMKTNVNPFSRRVIQKIFGSKGIQFLERKGMQKTLEISGKAGGLLIEGAAFDMTHTGLGLAFGLEGTHWYQDLPDFATRSLQSSLMLGAFKASGKLSHTILPPKGKLRPYFDQLVKDKNGVALAKLGAELGKGSARFGVEAMTLLLLSAGQHGMMGPEAFEAFLHKDNIGDEALHAMVTVMGLRAGGRMVKPLRDRIKKIEDRWAEREKVYAQYQSAYEALALKKNATREDIQRAYRELSKKYHPDRPGGNQEMFMKITEAYKILNKYYDQKAQEAAGKASETKTTQTKEPLLLTEGERVRFMEKHPADFEANLKLADGPRLQKAAEIIGKENLSEPQAVCLFEAHIVGREHGYPYTGKELVKKRNILLGLEPGYENYQGLYTKEQANLLIEHGIAGLWGKVKNTITTAGERPVLEKYDNILEKIENSETIIEAIREYEFLPKTEEMNNRIKSQLTYLVSDNISLFKNFDTIERILGPEYAQTLIDSMQRKYGNQAVLYLIKEFDLAEGRVSIQNLQEKLSAEQMEKDRVRALKSQEGSQSVELKTPRDELAEVINNEQSLREFVNRQESVFLRHISNYYTKPYVLDIVIECAQRNPENLLRYYDGYRDLRTSEGVSYGRELERKVFTEETLQRIFKTDPEKIFAGGDGMWNVIKLRSNYVAQVLMDYKGMGRADFLKQIESMPPNMRFTCEMMHDYFSKGKMDSWNSVRDELRSLMMNSNLANNMKVLYLYKRESVSLEMKIEQMEKSLPWVENPYRSLLIYASQNNQSVLATVPEWNDMISTYIAHETQQHNRVGTQPYNLRETEKLSSISDKAIEKLKKEFNAPEKLSVAQENILKDILLNPREVLSYIPAYKEIPESRLLNGVIKKYLFEMAERNMGGWEVVYNIKDCEGLKDVDGKDYTFELLERVVAKNYRIGNDLYDRYKHLPYANRIQQQANMLRAQKENIQEGLNIIKEKSLQLDQGPLFQPTKGEGFKALYLLARSEKNNYISLVEQLAEITGGKAMFPRNKETGEVLLKDENNLGEESSQAFRIREKSASARAMGYEDPTSIIIDILRGSLVFRNLHDMYAALKTIHEQCDIVQIKDKFSKEIQKSGYRDINITLRMPETGLLVELQLHVEGIFKQKGPDEKLYDVRRTNEKEMNILNIKLELKTIAPTDVVMIQQRIHQLKIKNKEILEQQKEGFLKAWKPYEEEWEVLKKEFPEFF
jgi:hypothetical protein